MSHNDVCHLGKGTTNSVRTMLRVAVLSLALSLALGEGLVGGPIAASGTPIEVACVGDSITKGYKASNYSSTYPGRLQTKLDAKYGVGSYNVSNFGADGATIQKHPHDHYPYWTRSQFKNFSVGTFDIVIIMFGTNDAKTIDWLPACSAPHPTAESCAVVKDYLSLIKLAASLGVGGKTPLMTIMTPPPLWRNGTYGMNDVTINDVLPRLTPQIASAAGLPPPIDIFSALGGTSDWRTTFPKTGCHRPATPPVPQPKSCELFCQVNESCDDCHPDDDGYDLLATQVFNFIVKN